MVKKIKTQERFQDRVKSSDALYKGDLNKHLESVENIAELSIEFNEFPMQEDLLTIQEMKVLKLIIEGLSVAEISKKLSIKKTATKNHIKSILKKSNFKSTNQLLARVIKEQSIVVDKYFNES